MDLQAASGGAMLPTVVPAGEQEAASQWLAHAEAEARWEEQCGDLPFLGTVRALSRHVGP